MRVHLAPEARQISGRGADKVVTVQARTGASVLVVRSDGKAHQLHAAVQYASREKTLQSPTDIFQDFKLCVSYLV